jgi:hypothetical protein
MSGKEKMETKESNNYNHMKMLLEHLYKNNEIHFLEYYKTLLDINELFGVPVARPLVKSK